MAQQHTPATLSIQRRLERWEIDHLRALCAVQAEEIERLKFELNYSDSIAEMWQRGHELLAAQIGNQQSVGLTQAGEIVAVDRDAAQYFEDLTRPTARGKLHWSATGTGHSLDLDLRHYDVLEAMEDGPLDAPDRLCAGSCVFEHDIWGVTLVPSSIDREGGAA